jgi:3-oxoacyl-(acyl-carrier-protein) synthase
MMIPGLMIGTQGRIFVSGRGVLLGSMDSVRGIWQRVVSGERIPGELPTGPELAARAGLPSGDTLILAQHQLLALAAVEEAFREAGLPAERNRLRGEGKKQRHPRWGCVGGSSLGGLAAMEKETSVPGYRPSPYSLSRWRGNSVAAVTALRHGLGGAVIPVNSASATGAQALFLAGTMILSGAADLMVAVVSDIALPPRLAGTMRRNGSVAAAPSSLPLSAGRSGMHPSAGAACIILESEAHAAGRGRLPLACWEGGSSVNEALHLLAPEDAGSVAGEEMISLLRRHGRVRGDVDWVSLHATGTPRFDAAEIRGLGIAFPDRLPWISAFKRVTGHALGASGLIEAALLAEGLSRGAVPPWPGGTDPELRIAEREPSVAPVPHTALQLAQGMGGTVVINLLTSLRGR